VAIRHRATKRDMEKKLIFNIKVKGNGNYIIRKKWIQDVD